MTTEDWYLDMGEAIKARDRAATMIKNWTKKLEEAEAAIEALRVSAHAEAAAETRTEPVQE